MHGRKTSPGRRRPLACRPPPTSRAQIRRPSAPVRRVQAVGKVERDDQRSKRRRHEQEMRAAAEDCRGHCAIAAAGGARDEDHKHGHFKHDRDRQRGKLHRRRSAVGRRQDRQDSQRHACGNRAQREDRVAAAEPDNAKPNGEPDNNQKNPARPDKGKRFSQRRGKQRFVPELPSLRFIANSVPATASSRASPTLPSGPGAGI